MLAQLICPYSNAMRNNIDVKLSVTPADGKVYDDSLRLSSSRRAGAG